MVLSQASHYGVIDYWHGLYAVLGSGPAAAWLGKQAVARVVGADAPVLTDRIVSLLLPLL